MAAPSVPLHAVLPPERLLRAFDAALVALDAPGGPTVGQRSAAFASLRDAITEYVEQSRSSGSPPERALAGMKAVLRRRRSVLPPSEATEELEVLVLRAFLLACYPAPVAAPATPLLVGAPLSARQGATLPAGER